MQSWSETPVGETAPPEPLEPRAPAVREPERSFEIRAKPFLVVLAVASILIAVLAWFIAPLLQTPFLIMYAEALGAVGVAYVFASILAWTGFANLYRYSWTLLIGSRSYRTRVARGDLYWEGRDTASLAMGSLFGLALLGLAGFVYLVSLL